MQLARRTSRAWPSDGPKPKNGGISQKVLDWNPTLAFIACWCTEAKRRLERSASFKAKNRQWCEITHWSLKGPDWVEIGNHLTVAGWTPENSSLISSDGKKDHKYPILTCNDERWQSQFSLGGGCFVEIVARQTDRAIRYPKPTKRLRTLPSKATHSQNPIEGSLTSNFNWFIGQRFSWKRKPLAVVGDRFIETRLTNNRRARACWTRVSDLAFDTEATPAGGEKCKFVGRVRATQVWHVQRPEAHSFALGKREAQKAHNIAATRDRGNETENSRGPETNERQAGRTWAGFA